jgi:predicted transcriptional regulator
MSGKNNEIFYNSSDALLSAVATIVSGYVSRHSMSVSELENFVLKIYNMMSGLVSTHPISYPIPQHPHPHLHHNHSSVLTPAIPIHESVTPEYIICLEDGKKLKMLKRHLRTKYHMTPDEYRVKWQLPSKYPMVAPNYAEVRSSLAKYNGLGTLRYNRHMAEENESHTFRVAGIGNH